MAEPHPTAAARRGLALALALGLAGPAALASSACAPTVRVQVDPINIYAKLDADVRVRLDREVQSLIQQNPDLF